MKKFALIAGAFVLWFLAMVGALAIALWLRLSAPETRLLVIAVAFIAFFGAFLPVRQLSKDHKSDL